MKASYLISLGSKMSNFFVYYPANKETFWAITLNFRICFNRELMSLKELEKGLGNKSFMYNLITISVFIMLPDQNRLGINLVIVTILLLLPVISISIRKL